MAVTGSNLEKTTVVVTLEGRLEILAALDNSLFKADPDHQ